MSDTKGLTRQQMADRIALEFQDGWIVNLGVGIPTFCSNTDIGDRHIMYHSENGVIGYGPIAPAGQEDLNLVNAGGQNVTLNPGCRGGAPRRQLRHHPRRAHRCHRDGRL
jgi:3-oxoacid CoA-transferase B subunit